MSEFFIFSVFVTLFPRFANDSDNGKENKKVKIRTTKTIFIYCSVVEVWHWFIL